MASSTCCTNEMHKLPLLHCAEIMLLILVVAGIVNGGGLSYDYYKDSCPQLEDIVNNALLPVLLSDVNASPAFLRLLFHDCQVQGCDASILLDTDKSRGITTEMLSSKNFGITNRDSIDMVKSRVEEACPGKVSCADLVILAARDAVAYSGGPRISVPLGRKDSVTASNLRADAQLPSSSTGIDVALQIFMSKGMSREESVAIIGGHTIGTGHCVNIVNRLYSKQPDSQNLDAIYGAILRALCPSVVPTTNVTVAFNDLTPVIFDSNYFMDILQGRGLFTVDSTMSIDPRTVRYVNTFAQNSGHFFQVFSSAFVKLSSAEVLTGSSGEIRKKCNQRN